jgi:hypothetical protein
VRCWVSEAIARVSLGPRPENKVEEGLQAFISIYRHNFLSFPMNIPPVSAPYVPERRRWVVLMAFALANLSNAVLWVTFAPISSLTEEFFNVSQTSVNAFRYRTWKRTFPALSLPWLFTLSAKTASGPASSWVLPPLRLAPFCDIWLCCRRRTHYMVWHSQDSA